MGGSNYNRNGTCLTSVVSAIPMTRSIYDVGEFPCRCVWCFETGSKEPLGLFPVCNWVGYSATRSSCRKSTRISCFGKLRASWGINGNINSLTDFVYSNTMALTSSNYSLTNKGLITAAAPFNLFGKPGFDLGKSKTVWCRCWFALLERSPL